VRCPKGHRCQLIDVTPVKRVTVYCKSCKQTYVFYVEEGEELKTVSEWNLPSEYFQEVERLKRDMPFLSEDELVKRIVEIMLKYNAMPKALKGFDAVKIVEENRREFDTLHG
jgi:hypothetical protein